MQRYTMHSRLIGTKQLDEHSAAFTETAGAHPLHSVSLVFSPSPLPVSLPPLQYTAPITRRRLLFAYLHAAARIAVVTLTLLYLFIVVSNFATYRNNAFAAAIRQHNQAIYPFLLPDIASMTSLLDQQRYVHAHRVGSGANYTVQQQTEPLSIQLFIMSTPLTTLLLMLLFMMITRNGTRFVQFMSIACIRTLVAILAGIPTVMPFYDVDRDVCLDPQKQYSTAGSWIFTRVSLLFCADLYWSLHVTFLVLSWLFIAWLINDAIGNKPQQLTADVATKPHDSQHVSAQPNETIQGHTTHDVEIKLQPIGSLSSSPSPPQPANSSVAPRVTRWSQLLPFVVHTLMLIWFVTLIIILYRHTDIYTLYIFLSVILTLVVATHEQIVQPLAHWFVKPVVRLRCVS